MDHTAEPAGDDCSPSEQDETLAQCEQRIDYAFQDRSLLRAALTHASGANHRLASNERLEFLGDAILGAIICETLYRRFPDYQEGDLTRIKSIVVSRQTCARVSESLDLAEFLMVGKGMSNTQYPESLMSDVLEALLAAIYLDGGHEAVREFIEREIEPEIDSAIAGLVGENFKSQLQQLSQREFGCTPTYQLIDEKGPDHSKCFKIAVQLAGNRFAAAWGRNKKEAEQRAANNALCQINDQSPPYAAQDEEERGV